MDPKTGRILSKYGLRVMAYYGVEGFPYSFGHIREVRDANRKKVKEETIELPTEVCILF